MPLLRRSHKQLWEAENHELQRGAALNIIGGCSGPVPLAVLATHAGATSNGAGSSAAALGASPHHARGLLLQPSTATLHMRDSEVSGLVNPLGSPTSFLSYWQHQGGGGLPFCSPPGSAFDLHVHADVRLMDGTPTKVSSLSDLV